MSDTRGEYRAIRRVLLDGPDFQKLPERARWVFVALKLNAGPAGIYVYYPEAIAHQLARQTGAPARGVIAAMNTLETAGWIRREANVLWLVGHLTHDPHMSMKDEKHRKAIQKYVAGLPRLAIVRAFIRSSPNWFPPFEGASNGLGWVFDGPSKGHPTTEPEREPESERDTEKRYPSAGREESPRPARTDSPAFAEAWALYPKRGGGNPKLRAQRAWNARIAEGVEPSELIAGVRRYAAWCAAEHKIGSEFVLQAATFFGPDNRWSEDWAASNGAGDSYTAAIAEQDAMLQAGADLVARRRGVRGES